MSETKKINGIRLSDFKTDPKKVNGGVWVQIGESSEILVASINNEAYRKLMARLLEPHRHFEQARKPIPPDITKAIGIKAISQTILLGWRGILEDDGTEIPYSTEEAAKALEIEYFSELVIQNAMNRDLFRTDNEDDNTKN